METMVATNTRIESVPPPNFNAINAIQTDYYPIALFEKIKNCDIDCSGHLFLLRFNNLKNALGGRWATKRELIFQFIETAFSRKFEKPNWCCRASETDFIFALPEIEPKFAARICAKMQTNVFTYFIGHDRVLENEVFEIFADAVTRIHFRKLSNEEIGLSATTNEFEIEDLSQSELSKSEKSEDANIKLEIRPFLKIEKILQLKERKEIGHRLGYELVNLDNTPFFGEINKLSPEIIQSIDLELLRLGLKEIRNLPIGQRKILLIIPINFMTVANAANRKRIVEDLELFCGNFGMKAVLELHGTQSVPLFKLVEICAILKNHCSAVLIDFPMDVKNLETLKQVRFDGFSIPNICAISGESQVLKSLKRILDLIKARSGFFIMRGLYTQRQAQLAQMAGFKHVSVK